MHNLSAPITEEQRQQFADEGYCLVPNLYDGEEIDAIEAFFEKFKTNGLKIYDGNVTYEEAKNPDHFQTRALHPHRYSDQVKRWFLHGRVAEALTELMGRPPLGVQTMYYFKPPGGRGQGMHQDNMYLLAKPTTCIAAWTAIDSADEENGCLWVVPGSHRQELYCDDKNTEEWHVYGDPSRTRFPRTRKPVAVPVPRGTTMFFGGNLIHGSGPNRTKDRSRRTFIGHYIDEASTQVAKYYHPVLNMAGEVVGDVLVPTGGGPCGNGYAGAAH